MASTRLGVWLGSLVTVTKSIREVVIISSIMMNQDGIIKFSGMVSTNGNAQMSK